jgi:hypothetical protein
MKNFVFIVVFMVVLKPILPVFEYIINYDYIAKVLCINKEKPALKCNGKCHLMKQLAKESESEKPLFPNKKAQHEVEVLFCQNIDFQCCNVFSVAVATSTTSNYINLYSFEEINVIFHPPLPFNYSIV